MDPGYWPLDDGCVSSSGRSFGSAGWTRDENGVPDLRRAVGLQVVPRGPVTTHTIGEGDEVIVLRSNFDQFDEPVALGDDAFENASRRGTPVVNCDAEGRAYDVQHGEHLCTVLTGHVVVHNALEIVQQLRVAREPSALPHAGPEGQDCIEVLFGRCHGVVDHYSFENEEGHLDTLAAPQSFDRHHGG